MAELPHEKPLVVICEHCNRSLGAAHSPFITGLPGTVFVAGGTVLWAGSSRPDERD